MALTIKSVAKKSAKSLAATVAVSTSPYASKTAGYLVIDEDSTLTGARTLALGDGLSSEDGGEGESFTLSVTDASEDAKGIVKLAGQLGGEADSPYVTGLRETSGPTLLAVGDIADGDVLMRSGDEIVGTESAEQAIDDHVAEVNPHPQYVMRDEHANVPGGYPRLGLSSRVLLEQAPFKDAYTAPYLDPPANTIPNPNRIIPADFAFIWQEPVLDQTLTSPPGSPTGGERHIVATGASGAWTGKDNQIATWKGGAWDFMAPIRGNACWVNAVNKIACYDGTNWAKLDTFIDHAELQNLNTGNPHPQYQQQSQKGANNGYAGLDNTGRVSAPQAPAKSVYTNGGGQAIAPADIGAEATTAKDQNNGYAGLDGAGAVNRPVKAVRASADPGSPTVGEVWINNAELKFRDNQGTPATQNVERQSNRNVNNGYAGLDGGGRVAAGQAPAKAVYTNGGGQAIAPADISAVATGRHVDTGAGLAGGGDLGADRTISIASFTGLVAKDAFPTAGTSYPSGPTNIASWDIGGEGCLQPIAIRLPPTTNTNLRTEFAFELDNTTDVIVTNLDTANPLDRDFAQIALQLMGDLASGAANNGRRVRRVRAQVNNTSGGPVTATLGAFKLRAYAWPRGGGGAV